MSFVTTTQCAVFGFAIAVCITAWLAHSSLVLELCLCAMIVVISLGSATCRNLLNSLRGTR